MSSQLATQFDLLLMASPSLQEGKLLFRQVAISGVDWDEILPLKVQDGWKNGWKTTICFVRIPFHVIILRII